jgi:hypothetical protein
VWSHAKRDSSIDIVSVFLGYQPGAVLPTQNLVIFLYLSLCASGPSFRVSCHIFVTEYTKPALFKLLCSLIFKLYLIICLI